MAQKEGLTPHLIRITETTTKDIIVWAPIMDDGVERVNELLDTGEIDLAKNFDSCEVEITGIRSIGAKEMTDALKTIDAFDVPEI